MDDIYPRPNELHPSLLVVSFEQFGFHIDTFEYCRHLCEHYRITYCCPDQSLPKFELPGVEVVYLERRPLGKVEIGLLCETSAAILRQAPDVVFLSRTKFSFLLRLRHPRTPMIFDIRSGSVEAKPQQRALENSLLRFNSWFFKNITVISEGLARQLRVPRRARILPLAAARPSQLTTAPRDQLRLIYVGTFKSRYLERTVQGIARFLAGTTNDQSVHYTIFGFGSHDESAVIRAAIRDHDLGHVVELRDRVDHASLPVLLAQHNVGVAFTPQVPWFEHQPSTKIYEYLHSGLLCIATDSAANRELITPDRGVLVADTAEDFARGLDRVLELLPRWNPETVAATMCDRTWERVVNDILEPILNEVRR